jgi:hypothetical protein
MTIWGKFSLKLDIYFLPRSFVRIAVDLVFFTKRQYIAKSQMLVACLVFCIPMSWGYLTTSIIDGLALLYNILETKVMTWTSQLFSFQMFVKFFLRIEYETFMRSSNKLLLNNVGQVLKCIWKLGLNLWSQSPFKNKIKYLRKVVYLFSLFCLRKVVYSFWLYRFFVRLRFSKPHGQRCWILWYPYTIGKLSVSKGALRWFDGVYACSSGVIEYWTNF